MTGRELSAGAAGPGGVAPARSQRAVRRWRWRTWVGWFVLLAAVTVLLLAARSHLDKVHVALAYLLVVLGASAGGGRAVGLGIAGAAFLAFNYLFLPPYYTLVIANPLDWLVLFTFLVVSIVAAQLLARAQATAAAATARAMEIDRLATLGGETLGAPGADEALQAIATVIQGSLGVDACEIYRRGADGALVRAAVAPAGDATGPARGASPTAGTWEGPALAHDAPPGLVQWLANGRQSAIELLDGTVRLAPPAPTRSPAWWRADPRGWTAPDDPDDASGQLVALTEVIHTPASSLARRLARPARGQVAVEARALLLPLAVRDHSVGVLRVVAAGGLRLLPEQARLLAALAYYAALGVERARLVESAERAEAERRLESLRSALLIAVSHDLRTPLTTIKGLAHEIASGAERERAHVIEQEADRLDHLVGDLLDLSRIQAGAVRPALEVNTVDDLVGAALQRAAGALGGHDVSVALPPDDVLAGRFDLAQTLRIVVNLLENAAKYAPAGTPIELRAAREGDIVTITVADRGPGIAEAERERVFQPFYRPRHVPPDARGAGLGLAIARGLAEAQGGSLTHTPRPGGGSAFVLRLPGADLTGTAQADREIG